MGEVLEAAVAELAAVGDWAAIRAAVTGAADPADPDPWETWFRGKTGLPVYVSSRTVFVVERGRTVAKVDLPLAVRRAVRAAADGTDSSLPRVGPPPGPSSRARVEHACPRCGAVRTVGYKYLLRARKTGAVCSSCRWRG